jgi:hypothetical protein
MRNESYQLRLRFEIAALCNAIDVAVWGTEMHPRDILLAVPFRTANCRTERSRSCSMGSVRRTAGAPARPPDGRPAAPLDHR